MSDEEPLQYSITESELRDWLTHAQQGIEPLVVYEPDQFKALEAAYKKRGEALLYIANRLISILDVNHLR